MRSFGTLVRFPPGVDHRIFLRDYWQQKPLLMRAALPAAAFSLTPDELAGLACEDELESRLIIEHAAASWEVRHGPFSETDFAALPEACWTLLVQDVDKYLPDVAKLIAAFDFVPGWRIDDIMISYATDQGGVGPHTDAYDVFLMQASGRRRWRLSHRQYDDQDLLPDVEQRILSRFETDEEWILEPGDILYLPPGVAHWGTAEGECMTYSLGFRSPSQQDLAADWFQHLVSLAGTQRLQDPGDLRADSLARLTDGVRDNAAQLLADLPSTQSAEFARWLGRYLTEPKPQFHIVPPHEQWTADDLGDWMAQDGSLHRHPFARISWTVLADGSLVLFCQGEDITLPASVGDAVSLIAEKCRFDNADLTPFRHSAPVADLLLMLINAGILEPDETSR